MATEVSATISASGELRPRASPPLSGHHDHHHFDRDDGFAIQRNVPEAVFAFPIRAFFLITQIPELAAFAPEEIFQAKIHDRFQDSESAEPMERHQQTGEAARLLMTVTSRAVRV